jgi:hypothetical protein
MDLKNTTYEKVLNYLKTIYNVASCLLIALLGKL